MTTESWSTERYAPGEQQPLFGGSRPGNLKQKVADKLHELAQTVSRKTAATEPDSQTAYYGQQASEILEESAEYLKQLDLKNVEASVRDYVKRNPGQSILIAGVAGLVLGAILRRR
jgi:ElaB/YqjD/DUF883 family membrane-anchored ribosome-binding protein